MPHFCHPERNEVESN